MIFLGLLAAFLAALAFGGSLRFLWDDVGPSSTRRFGLMGSIAVCALGLGVYLGKGLRRARSLERAERPANDRLLAFVAEQARKNREGAGSADPAPSPTASAGEGLSPSSATREPEPAPAPDGSTGPDHPGG